MWCIVRGWERVSRELRVWRQLSTVDCRLSTLELSPINFLARLAALWHIPCVTENTLTAGLAFLFGLCVGSFLNVCIWRIPNRLSIVLPASRCPKCGAGIRPYDNLPVLSWLLLRGKCRACAAPISALYPFVELLTGAAFAACVWQFSLAPEAFKWALFLALLIVLFFTDVYFRILPDGVNLFGALAGLAFSFVTPIGDGTAGWLAGRLAGIALSPETASFADAVLGGTLVALGLWGLAAVFSRIIGRAAMGFGDVKMMAMMGTFLGLKKSFLTLLLGSLLGTLLGVLLIFGLYAAGWKRRVAARAARRGMGSESQLRWALARRYELPLGTFLAVGAAATVFAAAPILHWYGDWFRIE